MRAVAGSSGSSGAPAIPATYGFTTGGGWFIWPGTDDKANLFVVYVEDHGAPGGGADRVWLEVHDDGGNVIAALSMGGDAAVGATAIGGGNVVVPH